MATVAHYRFLEHRPRALNLKTENPSGALWQALTTRNETLARKVLSENPTLANGKSAGGVPYIIQAVKCYDPQNPMFPLRMVDLFSVYDVNVNVTDRDQGTPLIYSCRAIIDARDDQEKRIMQTLALYLVDLGAFADPQTIANLQRTQMWFQFKPNQYIGCIQDVIQAYRQARACFVEGMPPRQVHSSLMARAPIIFDPSAALQAIQILHKQHHNEGDQYGRTSLFYASLDSSMDVVTLHLSLNGGVIYMDACTEALTHEEVEPDVKNRVSLQVLRIALLILQNPKAVQPNQNRAALVKDNSHPERDKA